MYISSTSLLTASALWVDSEWETLLEGSEKTPILGEVRTNSTLKPGRKAVLTGCSVRVSRCSSSAQCGEMEIRKSSGPYGTIVTSSSYINRSLTANEYSVGDYTYDGSMGCAFMLAETKRTGKPRNDSRLTVSVIGIETVLLPSETRRAAREESRPWNLDADPERSRLYNLSCATDGMTADDFAHGLAIYRAMQLEQPGRERSDVRSNLSRIDPMSVNDVVRSAYALLSDDVSSTYRGSIDVYTTCGDFHTEKGVPFVALTVKLTLVWVFLRSFVVDSEDVPSDAAAWREIAHEQARVVEYFLKEQEKEEKDLFGNDTFVDDEGERYYGGPQHVLSYTRRKYQMMLSGTAALGGRSDIV